MVEVKKKRKKQTKIKQERINSKNEKTEDGTGGTETHGDL
jgi:hypothetical protein